MKRLVSALCLACMAALLCALPGHAEEYEQWSDPSYDFHGVRHIYIDELHVPDAAVSSPMKAHRLKEYFFEQSETLDDWTLSMPVLPPPVPAISRNAAESGSMPEQPAISSAELHDVSSSDPAAGLPDASVPSEPISADDALPAPAETELSPVILPEPQSDAIPDEALASDLYVKASMMAYYIGTGLIPAHMEWDFYTVRDVAYDRKGRPHWFSRRISYPVYVPNTYVPMATVGVQFIVYDVKTGKVVSMSEDTRTRSSSNDLYGVYKRIIDRFYKNLKKDLKD